MSILFAAKLDALNDMKLQILFVRLRPISRLAAGRQQKSTNGQTKL
jgi:hypothetical protein